MAKPVCVSTRLPPDLLARLRREADKAGISPSWLLRQIVVEWAARHPEKEPT